MLRQGLIAVTQSLPLVIFIDTAYFVAWLKRDDPLHDRALAWARCLPRATRFVTSEDVLGETLTFLRKRSDLRKLAVGLVHRVRVDPSVHVVPMSDDHFQDALERYQARDDKAYSFVDCSSFVIMDDEGITAALTEDVHFEQEGYRALLREPVPD